MAQFEPVCDRVANSGNAPAAPRSDSLIKDATILFVTANCAGVFNLLFQLFLVRKLSQSDFGLLNALLVLITNLTIVAGPFQTVTTKFIATYRAENDWGTIARFFKKFGRHVLGFAFISSGLICAAHLWIRRFFNMPPVLESSLLVVLAAVIVGVSTVAPFLLGGLQGLQKFKSYGIYSMLSAVLKFFLAVFFVGIGWRVAGALFAIFLAAVFAVALTLIPLWKYIVAPAGCRPIPTAPVYQFILPTIIALFSFACLTSLDMLLVRRFFSEEEAGIYAIVQMVG
ncbi:MAG: oligosaccharide flippase family protein, partial [Candidatus Omnitrophica bacterium]|nr:oligosaccharide flippase family protein [Candidatus Omnitrophota bacterium]